MSLHLLDATAVHTSWAPKHLPRLTIDSGDEVEFRTRDGFDGQLDGLHRSALDDTLECLDFARIAPLSGPIEITGAEPGDALRIDILDLEPVGPGWTVVWPEWAGFDYHRPAGTPGAGRIQTFPSEVLRAGDWVVFGEARIPIRPMLGMVGVAPSHGEFGTLPPRGFGGNMDLRLVCAGSTLRLPVLVAGGLLSIGDGHAAQGDGELCTTAIECGMKGRMRISVERGAAPAGPVLETVDAWVSTGFGRTLDDAVKSAIDVMHSMIVSWGMDPTDAYILLSLAGNVGVNQVVNLPHVGARVSISKDVLSK